MVCSYQFHAVLSTSIYIISHISQIVKGKKNPLPTQRFRKYNIEKAESIATRPPARGQE